MILDAEQRFTLIHPGGAVRGLAFVRDPARALSQVRFLRKLRTGPSGVQGELLVMVPALGEIDLPFLSALHPTPRGASLQPLPLSQERAWVEVGGEAEVDAAGEMSFHFLFRAHLQLPGAEGWGAQAFEKMVRAAAGRTLERVAQDLPEGLHAALSLPEETGSPSAPGAGFSAADPE